MDLGRELGKASEVAPSPRRAQGGGGFGQGGVSGALLAASGGPGLETRARGWVWGDGQTDQFEETVKASSEEGSRDLERRGRFSERRGDRPRPPRGTIQ